MAKKTNKPNFSDAAKRGDMHRKAIEFARSKLEERGIKYPLHDNSISREENYERILSYAEQEAALVVEYLKAPSGPRPLVLDNTSSGKTEWKGYND